MVKGYIGKLEGLIYYTDGKDVFRAPESNVVDCNTGYLIGRWECTLEHFNRFINTVYHGIDKRCSECGSMKRGHTAFCADCGADL